MMRWQRRPASAGGDSPVRMYHVSKSYLAGSFALHDVSLEVKKGEFLFLTGPSGAGKTTLLQLLFAGERPSEGQILMLGRNIARLGDSAIPPLRRRIGVVFQDFKLLPRRTVEENVRMALDVVGTPRRQARARVFQLLKQVGLQHRRFHHPLSLSGGEQQRVALARALAPGPKILMADEPTGNLDGHTGQQVMDLIFALRERTGATLMLITHDAALAGRCGRVLQMRDGKIERPAKARRAKAKRAKVEA